MTAAPLALVYFSHLRELGWSWGTIAISRSSITAWHTAAGVRHALDDPSVTHFFSALKRSIGITSTPPKSPLLFPQFIALVRAFLSFPTLINLRDCAILLVSFIGMRRQADVLCNGHSGLLCSDVDLSSLDCVAIRLRFMKNDPSARAM